MVRKLAENPTKEEKALKKIKKEKVKKPKKSEAPKDGDAAPKDGDAAPKDGDEQATANTDGSTDKKRQRKRRAKPGRKALREIITQQKATDLLIRRAPFRRLARELAAVEVANMPTASSGKAYRFKKEALTVLQQALEEAIIKDFSLELRCAIHAGRVTVHKADCDLVETMLKGY